MLIPIARSSAASAMLASALVQTALPAMSASGPFASPVYKKMVARSAGLRSFEANIEVHTKLRGFPPVSLTFRGTTYFQAPDRSSVKFKNVPGPLKGMVKDSPSVAPAAVWPSRYQVKLVSDTGDQTTFHLVPKSGDDPLASADVVVDDQSGLVQQYNFANKNGSMVTTNLTYEQVGKYMLVASETGSANGRGYKSDVTTSFSGYRVNASIPPSAFATAGP